MIKLSDLTPTAQAQVASFKAARIGGKTDQERIARVVKLQGDKALARRPASPARLSELDARMARAFERVDGLTSGSSPAANEYPSPNGLVKSIAESAGLSPQQVLNNLAAMKAELIAAIRDGQGVRGG